MSEALRQHLLQPNPPPRVLLPKPTPLMLIPNMYTVKDRRAPPIIMENDIVIGEKYKQEAVMKIQRRRAQQRLRSQRYRERKRNELHVLKMRGSVQKAINESNQISSNHMSSLKSRTNIKSSLQTGNITHKSIGTIIPLNSRKQMFASTSAKMASHSTKTDESLLGTRLDRTKSLMRRSGIVLGFEWKTDSDGRKYLASSKLVRVNAKNLIPKRRISDSQDLSFFNIKVEQNDSVDYNPGEDQPPASDWQCLPVHNDWAQDGDSILIKTEEVEEPLEKDRLSEKSNKTRKGLPERLILRREHSMLNCCRYCLYRRLALKAKCLHTLYISASRRGKSTTAKSSTPPDSPLPLLSKQSNVTKDTVRITQACSIALFKVRNHLKKKSQKIRLCKSVGSKASVGLAALAPASKSGSDLVPSSRAPKRPLSISSDSAEEGSAPRRKSARLGGQSRKILKVRRERERAREVREACGYDGCAEDEEEQRERSIKVRKRRNSFLRSNKQSVRLHTAPQSGSVESREGSSPRIISIESLSGSQALSWEVIEDDLATVKEEPEENKL